MQKMMYRSKASKPKNSKRAAQAARSASALKGWKTRRANERKQAAEHKRRSNAAKHGWKTRRSNERKIKRTIAAYPYPLPLSIEPRIEIRVTSVEQWEDFYDEWLDLYGFEEEEWESTADYEEAPA